MYIFCIHTHTHPLMDDHNVQHTTTLYNILTHHNTQGACLTITTRQNIQLYGIRLENVPEHWEALRGAGIFSLQAGMYMYIYTSHILAHIYVCVRACLFGSSRRGHLLTPSRYVYYIYISHILTHIYVCVRVCYITYLINQD